MVVIHMHVISMPHVAFLCTILLLQLFERFIKTTLIANIVRNVPNNHVPMRYKQCLWSGTVTVTHA